MPISPQIAANKAAEIITDQVQNAQGQKATAQSIQAFNNSIEKSRESIESARSTQEELNNLIKWPQNDSKFNPSKTIGFLPPVLVSPTLETLGNSAIPNKFNKYEFTDWRGQNLKKLNKSLTTEDRFKLGKDFPRENPVLVEKPYSRRDVDLIFGDARSDYFKHGLQVIDGLNPIENPANGSSDLRLSQFKETPWEQNDPVMYGFDIIFDSQSSPLLNGSLTDFIVNYNGVSEISTKRAVYEEFKNQFSKFFKTTTPLGISQSLIAITKTTTNVANLEGSSSLYSPGKKNYLGYYLKKVSGLDFLIEQNKGDTIKYTPEYKKDFITLDFMEDVTLSIGTLAHLYKVLYWSKPNGKMLIPENLLRFNCQIIISECRNFNRVKKSVSTQNISVIKDNLSRWVYSVRDCQFYFDKMSVPNEVDLGGQGPQIFENYQINFDFKYSSVKLERFIPAGDWGRYVGYDGGSLWKIGNAGTRNARGTTSSLDLSSPNFFTVGPDQKSLASYPSLRENGVDKPYILAVYGPNSNQKDEFKLDGQTESSSGGSISDPQTSNLVKSAEALSNPNTQSLENIAKQSEQVSAQIQEQQTNQEIVDTNNSLKKTGFGSIQGKLTEQALNKVKKPMGTPLSTVVAVSSKSDKIVSGNFFDKMSSLKIEDGLKSITSQKLTNFSGLTDQLSSFDKVKGSVPSLDSVKTMFSAAKSQATTGFFDVRGNLKSSLSEGKNSLLSGLGGLDNLSVSSLTNGLTDKVKGSVPSLDSVKTKFSAAKTEATSGFFDIRGNLKSSLSEGKNLLSGLGGLDNLSVSSLTNGLTDKVKGSVPSLDSVKTMFSAAKSQATTGFFDVRGNLKSSLSEGKGFLKTSFNNTIDDVNSLTEQTKSKSNKAFGMASNLLNQELNKAKDTTGNFISTENLKEKFSTAKEISVGQFFDIRSQVTGENGKDTGALNLRKNLLNNTIDKIYGSTKAVTSPLTSDAPPATSFFDLKNQLKDFLGGSLGNKVTGE